MKWVLTIAPRHKDRRQDLVLDQEYLFLQSHTTQWSSEELSVQPLSTRAGVSKRMRPKMKVFVALSIYPTRSKNKIEM